MQGGGRAEHLRARSRRRRSSRGASGSEYGVLGPRPPPSISRPGKGGLCRALGAVGPQARSGGFQAAASLH
eukprot:15457599-Alexandrium_andersonii.AAC.1